MSIVSVELLPNRQSSSQIGSRQYTRTYIVVTDDIDDDEEVVRLSVPEFLGDVHPSNSNARVSNKTSTEQTRIKGGGSVWQVQVTWDTSTPESTEDPLDEPIQYSWSAVASEEVFDVDVDGEPVVNSADDPFSDGITRQTFDIQLSVSHNLASFDGSLAASFVQKLNDATFHSGPAGTVLCTNISAQGPNEQNGIEFWAISYEFLYRKDGWDKKVLDAGFNYKLVDGMDCTRKKILVEGREPTSPVLLDGNGEVLTCGDEPVVLTFKPYERVDFSTLGI